MPFEPQEGGLLGSFLGFLFGTWIGVNWKKLRETTSSFAEKLTPKHKK